MPFIIFGLACIINLYFSIEAVSFVVTVAYDKSMQEKNILNEALNCSLNYMEMKASNKGWNLSIDTLEARKHMLMWKTNTSILSVIGPVKSLPRSIIFPSFLYGRSIPYFSPLFPYEYHSKVSFSLNLQMTQPFKQNEVNAPIAKLI